LILSAPRLRPGGRPAGWRRGCAALLGGLLLASCGKRGDPLPPLRRTPQPVTNLRVSQRGDRLEVSFVAPRGYADQARLPILEVELFRAEGEGDFDKVARKDRRRVAPGERIVEDEPIPEPGSTLRFAARAIAKGRPSARTALVSITIATPPETPTGLAARSAELGVALEWVPPANMPVEPEPSPSPSPSPSPAELESPSPGAPAASPSPSATPAPPSSPAPSPSPSAGPSPLAPESPPPAAVASASPSPAASPSTPVGTEATAEGTASPSPGASPSPLPSPSPTPRPRTTGFFVYRRAQLGSYEQPLQPAPIAESSFVDATAVPGDELCYIVRTVASTDPVIESADSEESCLNVHDANPPAAPVGVAAQVRPDGIEISWSPSPEPDVAFYRVYRQAQGARKQIAQVPVRELVYVDAGAPVGVAERYFVTAVDKAGNESQRSAAASATRR
jgi:hypothetical protein